MTAATTTSLDIHRAAFLRLVECWRALNKAHSGNDICPEDADMCLLTAIRLCSTKLAGTGIFAQSALGAIRQDAQQFSTYDWHLISLDLLFAALRKPDPDEQTLPCGRQRRLQSYLQKIAPLISRASPSCCIRALEMLWACKDMDDGLTSITYALYSNVRKTHLYANECFALLFYRVGNRLIEDGAYFFDEDAYKDRLSEAGRGGPGAYTNTFKYLDDEISERLEWAYGGLGRSIAEVEQIEKDEYVSSERKIVLAALEREALDLNTSEARFYLGDHYLRIGKYRKAVEFIYPIRAEKHAAEILMECFHRCSPGELDDWKWLDAQPESKKCLAADVDALGHFCQGACRLKHNGKWDVRDGNESDFNCDWTGNWTLCPRYCGSTSGKPAVGETLKI